MLLITGEFAAIAFIITFHQGLWKIWNDKGENDIKVIAVAHVVCYQPAGPSFHLVARKNLPWLIAAYIIRAIMIAYL